MPQIRDLIGGKTAKEGEGITFQWSPGRVTVLFRNGRRQFVDYRIEGEHYIFTSKVARRAVVEQVGRDRLAREILLRNRLTDVVVFRLSEKGQVEGFIEQRAATLQAEELRFYLGLLAREADRFEFLLSGLDYH
jgi:hypothetical protein